MGRLGDAPEWPDEVVEPNPDELTMWRRLWTLPQALVWEADHVNDMVAFYVRTYLEAMHPRAGAQARTFVGQMSEKLLLTPQSLASARYVIESSAEARAIDAAVAVAKPSRKSAKERLGIAVVPDLEDDGPPEEEVPF